MSKANADDRVTSFVREHYAFVWRVLRRLGLAPDDAEDAAQRVMISATQRIQDIQPDRERAFLFRTARFVASRAHRDRKRRREDNEAEQEQHVDPGLDPEALAAEREARQSLDRVLERMPADLRAAFMLFEIEGLSKSEVADALEIPAGTAASRLRRAREEFLRQAQRLGVIGRHGVSA